MSKQSKKAKPSEEFAKFQSIPLAKLKKAPWNYKTTDDALQAKLVENIKRNGQIENLLVRPLGDGFYEVTNGNHRVDALNTLEYESAFCFDLGDITEAQAKRIAIETNETRFESDPMQLAKIVKEITAQFDDFSTTAPFSQDQLENFNSMLDFDWDAADASHAEEKAENEEAEKGKRTETVLSVGGEDFKVLKLELSSMCADRFSFQLNRLTELGSGSGDGPIDIICGLLEGVSDEQLHLDERPGRRKTAKKSKRK